MPKAELHWGYDVAAVLVVALIAASVFLWLPMPP
jgi:hypothetical protein